MPRFTCPSCHIAATGPQENLSCPSCGESMAWQGPDEMSEVNRWFGRQNYLWNLETKIAIKIGIVLAIIFFGLALLIGIVIAWHALANSLHG